MLSFETTSLASLKAEDEYMENKWLASSRLAYNHSVITAEKSSNTAHVNSLDRVGRLGNRTQGITRLGTPGTTRLGTTRLGTGGGGGITRLGAAVTVAT